MSLNKDEVVKGMSRAAKGIYIAVEEIVADDISDKFLKGIGLIEQQSERIGELESLLVDNANAIDELVRQGLIEHHPNVELDALTDGMRSTAQK